MMIPTKCPACKKPFSFDTEKVTHESFVVNTPGLKPSPPTAYLPTCPHCGKRLRIENSEKS